MKKVLIRDIPEIEEIESCFKSQNKIGKNNYCFYGDEQGLGIEKIARTSAVIVGGTLIIADFLGVMEVSRGEIFLIGIPISLFVIVLWLIFKRNSTVGYMLNQTETGLYVIPVYEEKVGKYIDTDFCFFVVSDDINYIKMKRSNVDRCVLKIKLKDNRKFMFKVNYDKKSKENIDVFASMYGCDIEW